MNTLKEILDELKERIIDQLKEEGILEPDEKGYRGVEIISAATIPELENAGWIVGLKNPKRSGTYNVTRFVGGRFLSDVAYFDGDRIWHSDNRVNHMRAYLIDVVAWKPLPEPYQPDIINSEQRTIGGWKGRMVDTFNKDSKN